MEPEYRHSSPPARPAWVDRTAYPFTGRRLSLPAGRLHYVDEGEGRPVILVHGTPSWSFLYRRLILCLAPRWRVVAPDHLGFGLSDKPPEFPHRPADHARNLATLITELGLRDVTLVVHDFGGPIGLAYALAHPENVHSLVIVNTWLWSLRDKFQYRASEKLFSSALGRIAYLHANLSPKYLLPLAFGDRRLLTEEIHRHYVAPFATAADRRGPHRFAEELTAAASWYESLWAKIHLLRDKPVLLVWGMRDRFMPPDFLERWRSALPQAAVRRYPTAGHFVQEEAPEELCADVRRFLREPSGGSGARSPSAGPDRTAAGPTTS